MNRTEIVTLGEFGLIEHLTKPITPVQPTTKKGIGDDAAVLDYGGMRTLVTTDLCLKEYTSI
jgi:thiamine-monophosphate kinase